MEPRRRDRVRGGSEGVTRRSRDRDARIAHVLQEQALSRGTREVPLARWTSRDRSRGRSVSHRERAGRRQRRLLEFANRKCGLSAKAEGANASAATANYADHRHEQALHAVPLSPSLPAVESSRGGRSGPFWSGTPGEQPRSAAPLASFKSPASTRTRPIAQVPGPGYPIRGRGRSRSRSRRGRAPGGNPIRLRCHRPNALAGTADRWQPALPPTTPGHRPRSV